VLFGANASGKSNVLKALSFLSWFVRESFRAAPESWMPYQRFNDENSRDLPTHLAVHFAGPADLQRANEPDVAQCRYAYEVSLGGPGNQPPRVVSEVLKYWPAHAGRQVRLFERDEKGAVGAGKEFGLSGFRQALEKVLRPNASVVSTLTQLKHPQIDDAAVLAHLTGTETGKARKDKEQDFTMGVYPLLSDETCWFVAADFDKADWNAHDCRRQQKQPRMVFGEVVVSVE